MNRRGFLGKLVAGAAAVPAAVLVAKAAVEQQPEDEHLKAIRGLNEAMALCLTFGDTPKSRAWLKLEADRRQQISGQWWSPENKFFP